jgi:hypothetical protein
LAQDGRQVARRPAPLGQDGRQGALIVQLLEDGPPEGVAGAPPPPAGLALAVALALAPRVIVIVVAAPVAAAAAVAVVVAGPAATAAGVQLGGDLLLL